MNVCLMLWIILEKRTQKKIAKRRKRAEKQQGKKLRLERQYNMRVYISGAISGVKDYEKKFSKAEKDLKAKGYETINPCTLPHDHDKSYESYMKE